MNRSGTPKWRASLSLELGAWVLASSIFLALYVGKYEAGNDAIAAHLAMLLPFWLISVGARLLGWKHLSNRHLMRWLSALLTALPWIALVVWYSLVLIGLSSWGRVTTWALIYTYALQASSLMDALDVPAWIPSALTLLLPIGAVLSAWRWFSPEDWTQALAGQLSPTGSVFIGVLLCIIFPLRILTLPDHQDSSSQEPLQLSFFPHLSSQRQSHILSASPLLDSAESSAWKHYRPRKLSNSPNVIVIVGDALRSDHMGIYGYERPTTPFLDQASRQQGAAVIPLARSTCAESSCGLLSLASSRTLQDLPNKPITLHQVLGAHGYGVHMLLGGDHTNFYGLREAYGPVDSYHDGSTQSTRYMNDDLLVIDQAKALPAFNAGKPVMLQFHLMSTHGLGKRHEQAEIFKPFTNYYLWPQEHRVARTAQDARNAINYYDNGVRQFDSIVAQLVNILELKGYLQNALIVVTGDHGEMLGEHDLFGHRRRVEEAALSIPMIFLRYGYDGEPLIHPGVSSQIDIAPTILADLQIERPSTWRGRALQLEPAPRFIHFQQARMAGVYDTRQGAIIKYWKDFKEDKEYAFDIVADPRERQNLIGNMDKKWIEEWRNSVSAGQLITEGEIP